jgi:hypothetical protein
MLRITNPLSSKAATRYYNTSLAQADYYAEEPGFVTFSVPKSVSLYVAMSGDRQVERMIMESFRETMASIENAMQTRVRGKGQDGARLRVGVREP